MSDIRQKIIDLIIEAKREDPESGSLTEHLADYLIANGVTMKKTQTDLSEKCGSCKFAEHAPGVFGSSQCYIRCTHPEHKRRYYKRPISQYKQRTLRACKKYVAKETGLEVVEGGK